MLKVEFKDGDLIVGMPNSTVLKVIGDYPVGSSGPMTVENEQGERSEFTEVDALSAINHAPAGTDIWGQTKFGEGKFG